MFRNNGEFINKIGNKGQGPGEHSKHFKFNYLPEENKVAIYDNLKNKVFLYDLNGTFITEVKLKFKAETFVPLNNHLIFFTRPFMRQDSEYHAVIVTDIKGNIKKRLLHRPEEKRNKQNGMFPSIGDVGANYLGRTFSFMETSFEKGQQPVWEITEDFTINNKYTIAIGENVRPLKEYKDLNNSFFKYNTLHKYIETSKYVFLTAIWGDKDPPHAYFVYNKETDECSRIYNTKGFFSKHTFINDIDGGIDFFPFWRVSENKVVLPIHASQLKKYKEIKRPMNITKTLDVDHKNFMELLENVQETSNPILMIVTLK